MIMMDTTTLVLAIIGWVFSTTLKLGALYTLLMFNDEAVLIMVIIGIPMILGYGRQLEIEELKHRHTSGV